MDDTHTTQNRRRRARGDNGSRKTRYREFALPSVDKSQLSLDSNRNSSSTPKLATTKHKRLEQSELRKNTEIKPDSASDHEDTKREKEEGYESDFNPSFSSSEDEKEIVSRSDSLKPRITEKEITNVSLPQRSSKDLVFKQSESLKTKSSVPHPVNPDSSLTPGNEENTFEYEDSSPESSPIPSASKKSTETKNINPNDEMKPEARYVNPRTPSSQLTERLKKSSRSKRNEKTFSSDDNDDVSLIMSSSKSKMADLPRKFCSPYLSKRAVKRSRVTQEVKANNKTDFSQTDSEQEERERMLAELEKEMVIIPSKKKANTDLGVILKLLKHEIEVRCVNQVNQGKREWRKELASFLEEVSIEFNMYEDLAVKEMYQIRKLDKIDLVCSKKRQIVKDLQQSNREIETKLLSSEQKYAMEDKEIDEQLAAHQFIKSLQSIVRRENSA